MLCRFRIKIESGVRNEPGSFYRPKYICLAYLNSRKIVNIFLKNMQIWVIETNSETIFSLVYSYYMHFPYSLF